MTKRSAPPPPLPDQTGESDQARRDPRTPEEELRARLIGRRLREMYDAVVNEPVPDDLLRVLEEANDGSEEPS